MMATCNVVKLTDIRSGFRIDSEFYRKEFVDKDIVLAKFNPLPLWRIAKVTDGEHGAIAFVEKGIKCLTAEHIRQGFVDCTGVRFITPEVDQRNARARVNEGDVLISIKGTLGEVALAEKSLLPANMNRDVAIIKLHSDAPNGAYITPFLRSEFGKFQLSREGSGGVQQMITLERLKCINIPIFSDKIRDEIASLHLKGLAVRQDFITLYEHAKHLLTSAFSLSEVTLKRLIGFISHFSGIEQARRSDAQHYQPQFIQLFKHLSHFKTKRIREIRTYNRRGVQPVYIKNGPINVVNSRHIGPQHIDYDGLQKTSKEAFYAFPEAHIQKNDLLIYTTGAYIGRTNAYLKDTPALASNHVNILRLTPDIDAAYMALVFQSVIGQFQTQKHARGSAQAELYSVDIDRFIVPLIEPSKQSEIGDLVRSSLKKREESKTLLEQAKNRVEQLIEEAAKS